jgi:HSP20 family protein
MKPVAILSLNAAQLERLRNEIHGLFEGLNEANTGSLMGAGFWSPPVDVCDAIDSVTVRVELPGVPADQISVSYCDGLLKISGEKREQDHAQRPVCYICMERSYGSFSRSLRVPFPVDINRAMAKLVDGVLLIKLPKLEERRQKEIRIEVSES